MKKRRRRQEEEEVSYWQSYSDMMAALLLIFILILTFCLFESKHTIESDQQALADKQAEFLVMVEQYKEQKGIVDQQQEALAAQEDELAAQEEQLAEQQDKMAVQESTLLQQALDIASKTELLAAKEEELALSEEKLKSKEEELAAAEEKLKNQEDLLSIQQGEMDAQQLVMDEQQQQIARLLGVKTELITALRDEFDESGFSISVDPQNGNIRFDSSVLFAKDDYQLTEESKTFLKEFFPRYLSVLMDGRFADYIAEIIVEGHTARSQDWLMSLSLSQQRAFEVASYILSEDSQIIPADQIDSFRRIITANGRSFSDPLYLEDGTIDMEGSRRVEIKFRLKDDEVVSQMSEILNTDTVNP